MTWIMFYALFEKESWNEKYEIILDYLAEYNFKIMKILSFNGDRILLHLCIYLMGYKHIPLWNVIRQEKFFELKLI